MSVCLNIGEIVFEDAQVQRLLWKIVFLVKWNHKNSLLNNDILNLKSNVSVLTHLNKGINS